MHLFTLIKLRIVLCFEFLYTFEIVIIIIQICSQQNSYFDETRNQRIPMWNLKLKSSLYVPQQGSPNGGPRINYIRHADKDEKNDIYVAISYVCVFLLTTTDYIDDEAYLSPLIYILYVIFSIYCLTRLVL